MPIPTRTASIRQPGADNKSKISALSSHKRAASTVVPSAEKPALRAHQRVGCLVTRPDAEGLVTSGTSSIQRTTSLRNPAGSIPQQHTQFPSRIKPAIAKPIDSVDKSGPNADTKLKTPTTRPQFSAYQQHFSPKKLIREPSVASDAPSTEETTSQETLRSPEVKRLQDELLQLQLIHNGSSQTLRQYQDSTKAKSKARFEALVKEHQAVQIAEEQRDCCLNHSALQEWLKQDATRSMSADKLQVLATCIRDLEVLTSSEGRLSQIVQSFERWFENMVLAVDARLHRSGETAQDLLFVEPIGSAWSEQAVVLRRRLEACVDSLRSLGIAQGGGIAFVLNSHLTFAENLLQEVGSCITIHSLVLEQEENWVTASTEQLLDAGGIANATEERDSLRKGVWAQLQ